MTTRTADRQLRVLERCDTANHFLANQHTPGPWKADGKVVSTAAGTSVATCPWTTDESWTHDVTENDAIANARLIAAAPDLLATLNVIADHLAKAPKFSAVEYSDELLVPYSDIEKYARAAIAKATNPV